VSVFSFSKTETVWGVKTALTLDLINWWIARAGHKPYLLKIQESYHHGINHGDMSEVVPEDKAELRDMVQLMLKDRYEERYHEAGSSYIAELRASLGELARLLNADLEGTPFYREHDVSDS
jgi:hypothetical protein